MPASRKSRWCSYTARTRTVSARLAGIDIDQPQLDPARGGVHVTEGHVALVRRPQERGQRQRLRQAGDAAFLATIDGLQPEVVDEREAAGGIGARVDAQPAELEFRLGDHVDARQCRAAQVGGKVTAW